MRQGLEPAFSLAELGRKLEAPGPLWLYVPHGKPTDQTIAELEGHLQQGDLIAEGGNSHWQDSVRHYEALRAQGIAFLDAGTSGDLEGARHGACFMVGGEAHGSRDQASHSR